MVNMIERRGRCYQVHDVEFGQCDCGERRIATPSETTCRWCGQDQAAILLEESDVEQVGDEAVHPWRYSGEREDPRIPL
jgi:hypothetical protein